MDASGQVVPPDFSLWYYKADYQVTTANQVVPPTGLKMVVGSMRGSPTSPQPGGNADPTLVKGINYAWNCKDDYRLAKSHIPTDCNPGEILGLHITFPTCWNGRDLDSPDHISHMRYGSGQGACPASHPVQIPTITLNIEWKVPQGGTAGWRLSSDMYTVNSQNPGGYSTHADWINGWDPDIMRSFINNCNNAEKECGVDNLGDGTRLDDRFVGRMYR